MYDPIEIPLFPLQTVLFPGQLLPLHIFEKRYQLMIQSILGQDAGFGVVFIRQGSEVGETADIYDVGTIARIKQIDSLPDGRMNLLCLGGERFRIRQLYDDQPYLIAQIELWPWEPGSTSELKPAAEEVKAVLYEYLQLLTDLVGGRLVIPETPDDPILLAGLAGFALRIPNREKQALLSLPSIETFMDTCAQILRREIHTLRSTGSIPDVPDEPTQSYTPN